MPTRYCAHADRGGAMNGATSPGRRDAANDAGPPATDDVLLDRTPDWARHLADEALTTGTDVDAALDVARAAGRRLPAPGSGTDARWAALAALARANVTVARVVEAHTDALAIRAEAGLPDTSDRTWGVFAAEGPASAPGPPLRARAAGRGFVLDGVKPWCSLGGVLDAALVTAHVEGGRRLFAVDLHERGIRAQPTSGWVSRGLPTVTSVGLEFENVPAEPVGRTGWYLTRRGFAWGGMGVAACWHGAAHGVADRLGVPRDDLQALHRGRVDATLHAAGCVLLDAAGRIDAGVADGAGGTLLALRVRATVADAAEVVLREVGHASGPAPLAFDEAHAARVADLTIYVRQHHGERDLAALGRELGGPGTQITSDR